MLRIKLPKWPRLAGKRYKHMVTLRWQWYSTQRGNTHKHANIRTEIQGWTYMLFILHFPANFFWLTESTVLVSHWSQLIRCYAIDRAWLVERVFTEGPQWAAVLPAECLHPRESCVSVAWFCESLCLLLDDICTSVFIRVLCVSVAVPFTVCVSVLLCHPTLPIITHKKETTHIPLGRMPSHIEHINRITKRGVYGHADSVSSLLPPLQLHLMYCRETQIDIAGGHPTAGITGWYAYLKFVIKRMVYNVACWRLSMLACSADAVWGRILGRNLHSFNLNPLSRLSSQ